MSKNRQKQTPVKFTGKYRHIWVTMLIALGISVMVNITDLMFVIRMNRNLNREKIEQEQKSGWNWEFDHDAGPPWATHPGEQTPNPDEERRSSGNERTGSRRDSQPEDNSTESEKGQEQRNLDSTRAARWQARQAEAQNERQTADSLREARWKAREAESQKEQQAADSSREARWQARQQAGTEMGAPDTNPERDERRFEERRPPGENMARYYIRMEIKRGQLYMSAQYQAIQIFYFFLLGFVLIIIATRRDRKGKSGYVKKLLFALGVAAAMYFIAPIITWEANIGPQFMARHIFDSSLMLKWALTVIIALLSAKIYELMSQRQKMVLENEWLKNESLQATYNTLVNQINPHFLFNSLNSLSMLVRENHNDTALAYIDRLSDTFRYILQNSQTRELTLREELDFTRSYMYVLEARYEGKLFFDISIEEGYEEWRMPTFSIQPLIENAVKHNTITKSDPLRISIRNEGANLIVSNSIKPKLDPEEGTGIGLRNLSDRYKLLTGKDIRIVDDGKTFSVVLPLTPPEK